MIAVDLAWVAEAVTGELQLNGSETTSDAVINRVTIDSRDVQAGDLFIAIQGPRFDGHDYAAQAIQDGAVAVISMHALKLDAPVIVVKDTRYALGQLAAAVKQRCEVKTIAMTGSSGKTTVKEMCAAILRQHGKVLATQGNFNNDIGVPLTLLNHTPEHDYAVIELGANHRGEIAYTTGLTKPDVALINNVSPAHVEGFGDIWGVAHAKSEIAKGLPANGVIWTNGNSRFHSFWLQEYAQRQHKVFAVANPELPKQVQADIWAQDIQLDAQGCAAFTLCLGDKRQPVKVPIPGEHNVANAVAAAALCSELGVNIESIASGIASIQPVPGRMNVHTVRPNLRIIDDTYNANVASAKAAIDALASFNGYRVMVLGDMGELGAHAREYHEEVGAHGIQAGIDNLFTLGVLSQSASETFNGHGGQHFDHQDALVAALVETMTQQQELTILVKGSRSARMERVVEALITRASHTNQGSTAC
ncbi:MAG: UDP-N-acetylmuramoyl-tripeptide--D-alanyl-D-alanine ligase [Idiomarina sp.]|nr:UDP-N-acetylmuramoyl-tripeptide--D-alanyl-D-alanine ligase [Idiomarina sp.]